MLWHFTDDLAKILLLSLENQAIEKKINVVLEVSLGNHEAIIQKINQYNGCFAFISSARTGNQEKLSRLLPYC